MNEQELHYLGGLFDAEGWFGIEARPAEYVEMAEKRLRTETYHGTGNAMEVDW